MISTIAKGLVGCLLCISSLSALAQTLESVDLDERRKKLIDQKYRLVESLLNAQSNKSSEAAASAQEGRKLLDQAREAISGNYLDRASTALDQALRNASKASAQAARQSGAADQSADQANYRHLAEQVATYRAALEDLVKMGGQAASQARGIGRRVDQFQVEAGVLSNAGKLAEANKKLAEAYKLAVESLSELRSGQTVTLSLKFDTPADEYEYELKRLRSGEIMVDMMLNEGRADGDRRPLVETMLKDGKQRQDEARTLAAQGKHKEAVALMEQALGYVNRALQVMGVPVF